MRRKDHNTKKAISPKQVAAIFTDQTRSQPQIAEQYRISQSMVSLIRSGKRWGSLTEDLPRYHREDFRHARSGKRHLTTPQIKDIYCSSLSKELLTGAYQVDRRTVERIRRRELHNKLTRYLVR